VRPGTCVPGRKWHWALASMPHERARFETILATRLRILRGERSGELPTEDTYGSMLGYGDVSSRRTASASRFISASRDLFSDGLPVLQLAFGPHITAGWTPEVADARPPAAPALRLSATSAMTRRAQACVVEAIEAFSLVDVHRQSQPLSPREPA
jgi:hypothetical protein